MDDSTKVIQSLMREGRKYGTDDTGWRRHQLTLAECKKRGVKFLPRQVMGPIFKKAGLEA
tara:strand:- start:3089 stop:3268 length:180 start_codon:yes stop_codon:yes gene_type:complete